MTPGNIVVQTNQMVQNGIRAQKLSEGSQVLVRIIKDNGNGTYEGSVAGARVSITSKNPVNPGTTFLATVSIKNGQIQLAPAVVGQDSVNQSNFQISILQNSTLSSFIKNLGLPTDGLSFHLLQQLKQLEMKLDPAFLNKIRNLSVKFQGKEKKAAELLMILSKKGELPSESDILALLELLYEDYENQGENNNDGIRLLNKINSVKDSWQILPFEIVDNQDSVLAKGNLKFFISNKNLLKLCVLECRFLNSKNSYFFSLEYEKGKCKKINYNFGQTENPLITSKLKSFIKNKLIEVQWTEREMIEGTACETEEFFVFGGEV